MPAHVPTNSERSALLRTFAYEPESGQILRTRLPKNGFRGNVRNTLSKNGYLRLQCEGRTYFAHRVAWFLHYGTWPAQIIDHRDGNRGNNKIGNLRLASYSENSAHRKTDIRNRVGLPGVTQVRKNGRWQSQIGWKCKRIYLGTFDTAEEAHAAYRLAAGKLHGDFSGLNREMR